MGLAQKCVIVLDPGHGGTAKVGGSSPNNATGPNGLLEKDLTLQVALLAKAKLDQFYNCLLTRDQDVNLGLAARADVARTNQAHAFVSIHLNGFDNSSVDGTETWIANNANQASEQLANEIQRQLVAVTQVNDRGVRRDDKGVLLPDRHAAHTAACLVEVAFLTNPHQAQRLQDAAYLDQIATAIYDAVRAKIACGAAAAQSLSSRRSQAQSPVRTVSLGSLTIPVVNQFDDETTVPRSPTRTVQIATSPSSVANRPGARSFDVGNNRIWYDVPLIPQPDKLSCWAGSMAMLVSFYQQQSITPEALAEQVGRSLRTSYSMDMLEAVRDHFGLQYLSMPSNASFAPEPSEWHEWLRDYGPLWVTTDGAPGHAIIVRGISGNLQPDGTMMDILDPWHRETHFDADAVDFHPPNPGAEYHWSFTHFANEFGNFGMFNHGDWRILYISNRTATSPKSLTLGLGAGAPALAYGVSGGQILDPFYRSAADKERRFGNRRGRIQHRGIDVTTSRASDAARGAAVYATIRLEIPVDELNAVPATRRSGDEWIEFEGVGLDGRGAATLDHALVRVQPWAPKDENSYGGVLGLACRYNYPWSNGQPGRFTIYVEFLHLITPGYPPKRRDGSITPIDDWHAAGRQSGFGPLMREGATLTPAQLTDQPLVGYLGATQTPHVHIQAALAAGNDRYLREPRIDPTLVIQSTAPARSYAWVSGGNGQPLASRGTRLPVRM